MKEFKGKVAVITGAASGIGRAIAGRCAQEGMKIVLADVEGPALAQAEQELRAAGAAALAVRTDVSKAGEVEALARNTLDTFGAVDLLFNNAGVGAGSTIWESTLADWQWVMGVNLCFTLAQRTAKVKASVLCPGWVKTQIMDSGRNRPPELQNEPSNEPLSPELEVIYRDFTHAVETGMPPQRVADYTFKAIRAEQFYILTHREFNPGVQKRMEDILQQRNPA